ncbi:hypothetical protein [Duganella sp. BuS-21]|uniref:hypothetical protein n=1 Tax=Duganella sp. BuS-21 TaxID=2943848 RepID=UPI0035A71CA1
MNSLAVGIFLKTTDATDILQPDDASLRLALAEVRDLQRTVVALRAELELSQQEGQRQVQDAVSAAQGDILQLRDTIVALRLSLERAAQERIDALQSASAAHHAEIAQLQDTIRAMRSALESKP